RQRRVVKVTSERTARIHSCEDRISPSNNLPKVVISAACRSAEPFVVNASSAGRSFAATRWSVVLAAADDAEAALAALCRGYWFPLYAFVRRQGVTPHDAEDLTQGFFAHLLGKGALAGVDRGKGRF